MKYEHGLYNRDDILRKVKNVRFSQDVIPEDEDDAEDALDPNAPRL